MCGYRRIDIFTGSDSPSPCLRSSLVCVALKSILAPLLPGNKIFFRILYSNFFCVALKIFLAALLLVNAFFVWIFRCLQDNLQTMSPHPKGEFFLKIE